MSTIGLAPCEYTLSPNGVLHLTSSNPEDFGTLCGEPIRKNWEIGDDTLSGVAATCLPCRSELIQRQSNVRLGNYMAQEGVDRCECGCKYWEHDHCIDCGAEWTTEARGED